MFKKINYLGVLYIVLVILAGLYLTGTFKRPKIKYINPLSTGVAVISKNIQKPKYTVFGFLPYWTLDKANYLQFDKLTDIAYFSLGITSTGGFQKVSDGITDPGYNTWKTSPTLLELFTKAKSYGIRIHLTITSHQDATTEAFLACTTCWADFYTNLIAESSTKGVTNYNFDFEYVGTPEPQLVKAYTNFIAYINNRLDTDAKPGSVSVSIHADSKLKPRLTNPTDLAKVADMLFIMSYDYHYASSEHAGPVAPIAGNRAFTEYDVQTMLKTMLVDISPAKLILGVPYYGYNWVTTSQQPYAQRRPGTDEIGYSASQAYEDIMALILKVNPQITWLDQEQAPYFGYTSPETGSNRVVHFENAKSLLAKYALIKQNNLQGVGIWALGYDGGYQELWQALNVAFF